MRRTAALATVLGTGLATVSLSLAIVAPAQAAPAPLTGVDNAVTAKPAAPATRATVSPLLASGVTRGTWRTPSGRVVSFIKINQATNTFQWVPGTQAPVSAAYSSSKDGPATYRNRMTAAFNGGFLLAQSEGGVALRGHVWSTLRYGKASLVVNNAGRLDIIKWTGGSASSFAAVRQNLTLLVDGGVNKVATRGNGCDSWGVVGSQFRHCPGERSAVGVTSRAGYVVYVYGYRVFADDLAKALIHLGVVRGMVMEMNQAWPRAYTYSTAGGSPSILDGNMSTVDGAYKNGYKRDFIVARKR